MGQVMMGGLKGCHFLFKDWDLNLLRGGHIDLLVGFRSRFLGWEEGIGEGIGITEVIGIIGGRPGGLGGETIGDEVWWEAVGGRVVR